MSSLLHKNSLLDGAARFLRWGKLPRTISPWERVTSAFAILLGTALSGAKGLRVKSANRVRGQGLSV